MPGVMPYGIIAVVLVFNTAVFFEWLLTRKKFPKNHTLTDTFTNLTLGLVFLLLEIVFASLLLKLGHFVSEYRVMTMPGTWSALFNGEAVNIPAFVALFFLEDLSFYWFHRVSHVNRFWWAIHENHHSSEHYNLSVALRQPPLEALTAWIFWVPLVLIGFRPEDILFQMAVNLFYQFWVHTRLTRSFGPLDFIMNTPSHHRVHHATNTKYLDKNYAGIFIIWDRLFGSFVKEEEEPRYGILRPINSDNPITIFLHDFRQLFRDMASAKSFKDKISYLFSSPGWKHDGTGKTVKQMQADL